MRFLCTCLFRNVYFVYQQKFFNLILIFLEYTTPKTFSSLQISTCVIITSIWGGCSSILNPFTTLTICNNGSKVHETCKWTFSQFVCKVWGQHFQHPLLVSNSFFLFPSVYLENGKTPSWNVQESLLHTYFV